MFTPRLDSSILLTTLMLAACGGGDPKRDVCQQIVDCDCGEKVYTSVEACVADVDVAVANAKKTAADNMLVFDQSCYEKSFDKLLGLECLASSEAPEGRDLLCPYCTAVHGDKPLGSPCTTYDDGASDCAGDLTCFSGVCLSLCTQYAAGEKCTLETDDGPLPLPCVDGYYCGDSGNCEVQANDGLPCDRSDACKSDYCDGAGLCGRVPAQGEACDFFCQPGLVCEDGACAPAPAAGQPCFNSQCALGSQCNDVDVCVLEDAVVCDIDFTPE